MHDISQMLLQVGKTDYPRLANFCSHGIKLNGRFVYIYYDRRTSVLESGQTLVILLRLSKQVC